MSFRHVKSLVLACSGAAALLGATLDANAGGLAVREQSAYGQGSSYAGVAAGGSLSSMFWNPATMTQMPGLNSEVIANRHHSLLPRILPLWHRRRYWQCWLSAALVPSSYYSWQFTRSLARFVGQCAVRPCRDFPGHLGRPQLRCRRREPARLITLTPTVAYKLSDWLSVGRGVQIQYASLTFTQGTLRWAD